MEDLASQMVDSLINDLLGILFDTAFLIIAVVILVLLVWPFRYVVKDLMLKKKK